MSLFNLAEDFKRRFSIRETVYEPKPEPITPSDPISPPPEEAPIDLVVSSNIPVKEDSPITPDIWQANIESSIVPTDSVSNIKTPSKRVIKPPVVVNNRQFRSAGTANWATIRKAVYPLYKDYCIANKTIPSIHEFSAIIGPRWKSLSPEDKAKACVNPSAYFTF
jgi:hypothetical protein